MGNDESKCVVTAVSPPQKKTYVDAPAPNVTVFGDRAFMEIKLNEVIAVRLWSNRISVPIRRGSLFTILGHSKKASICFPGRDLSRN